MDGSGQFYVGASYRVIKRRGGICASQHHETFYSNDKEKLAKSFNSAMKLTFVISSLRVRNDSVIAAYTSATVRRTVSKRNIRLVRFTFSLGLSIVFLAVMQTSVSVCQAVGKPYASVIIISFAIVVKAVVNLVLLPNPSVNIYGAAISETLCYLLPRFVL